MRLGITGSCLQTYWGVKGRCKNGVVHLLVLDMLGEVLDHFSVSGLLYTYRIFHAMQSFAPFAPSIAS
eukprot:3037871-Amphidinium_carterae.1